MRFSTLAVLAVLTGAALAAAQAPRPWMQGNVEYYCHQTEADIERMKKEFPEKADNIKLCACRHSCDPLDPHAGETQNRRWDEKCEARCNPRNCSCRHPCDS